MKPPWTFKVTEHTAAHKDQLVICCLYLLTCISYDLTGSWLPGDFLDGDIYDFSA